MAEAALLQEDEQKDKYLTFNLGEEGYGIDISHVIEIIGIQSITHVPDVPAFIKGIINLRGTIIPVLDVRTRFKKEEVTYTDRTCIIVIQIDTTQIGLIVDKVAEVLAIPSEQIVAPPELTQHTNRYIKGIGKTDQDVKLILDCHKLLIEEEEETLH